MPLLPGDRIGSYVVTARIGAGGMGEVYSARDTRLDRTVALKILSSELTANEAFRERFTREARAIARLNHPNICIVYDAGAANVRRITGTDAVPGNGVSRRRDAGHAARARTGFTNRKRLPIAMQLARALHQAHRRASSIAT